MHNSPVVHVALRTASESNPEIITVLNCVRIGSECTKYIFLIELGLKK